MRALVQRVARARVTIDGAVAGAIERGLLVYLGVGRGDDEKASAWILDKILGLRIFSNEDGKMDRSVLDVGGALLVVSQFTLYGDVRRGRRPSFDDAMPPATAQLVYDAFVREARARCEATARARVETGRFGADMMIESVNDGPVTIWLQFP